MRTRVLPLLDRNSGARTVGGKGGKLNKVKAVLVRRLPTELPGTRYQHPGTNTSTNSSTWATSFKLSTA
eukprot:2297430-Rhodomonas_salina.1